MITMVWVAIFWVAGYIPSYSATLTGGSSTQPAGEDAFCFGDVPLDGCVYVVDSVNGVDSAARDGRSVAAAWKTLAYAESRISRAGADLCLMDDSVFEDQRIDMWSGTADMNLAILATCYTDTADNSLRWASGGSGNGLGALAEINGNYDADCSVTLGAPAGTKCPWEGAAGFPAQTFPGPPVPASRTTGLIGIGTNDYVYINRVTLKNSAGEGIDINGTSSNQSVDVWIGRVEIILTARAGISANRTNGIYISNNRIEKTNLDGNRADKRHINHGVGLHVPRPYGPHIVSGNEVVETYGESMSPFACGPTGGDAYGIYRGNYLSVGQPLLHVDWCHNVLIEQNIFDGAGQFSSLGDGKAMSIGAEATVGSNAIGAIGIVIRRNLYSNVGTVLGIHCEAGPCKDNRADHPVQFELLSNTIVMAAEATSFIFDDVGNSANLIAGSRVANNVILGPVSANETCRMTAGGENVTFMNNGWSVQPGADCAGANDIIGGTHTMPAFPPDTRQTGWQTLHGMLTAAHFAYTTSSHDEQGTPLLDVLFNASDWHEDWAIDPNPCIGRDLLESSQDYYCNVRGNPPDMGAEEDGDTF